MIDLNDRFVILVIGLLIVLVPIAYLAIFGKVEKHR